jgi:hypothetical protein
MPRRTQFDAEVLKPTVNALAARGFRLVNLAGSVATFQKGDTKFGVVNDRGYWCLQGNDEHFATLPTRKTRSRVTKDAIAWIEGRKA